MSPVDDESVCTYVGEDEDGVEKEDEINTMKREQNIHKAPLGRFFLSPGNQKP